MVVMKRFAKSHQSLWETQALPQCNFSHQLIGIVAAFLTHSESLYEEVQNYTEVTRKKEQLLLKVQMILPPHTPPKKKGKEKVWAFLSISMSLILEMIALTLHMALTRVSSPANQFIYLQHTHFHPSCKGLSHRERIQDQSFCSGSMLLANFYAKWLRALPCFDNVK